MSTAHRTTFPPCVYFIRFGKSGPIKIGQTNHDPRGRLRSIQVHCPERLHILGIIVNPPEEWSEGALHRMFAPLRIAGEWFDSSVELEEFIAQNAVSIEVGDQPIDQPDRLSCECGKPQWIRIGKPKQSIPRLPHRRVPPDHIPKTVRIPVNFDVADDHRRRLRDLYGKRHVAPQRLRGRPRHADRPDQRQRQYKFARLVRLGELSLDESAAAAGVSTRTLERWLSELLQSDEPAAEGLRRIKRR